MADYSINAVTRRVVFSGSAGTGPYAFSFEVLTETDIAVYFNATLLTLTTDYTVTVNVNGTGSVTIVTGSGVPSTPVSSDQITIVGSRDIERTTDFVTAGDFRASAINEQLDSQIIMIQQVAEENKRGLRAPTYDPALVEDGGVLDLTLPTKDSRAGKILAFDSNGNPAVGEDIGNWRGNWAATTAYSVRDLVKDASNENVYRCNTAHTSSGTTPISSNADSAKWDLVVDVSTSAGYADEAEAWASKTDGIVESTDYSAKAWSIGGTGVTSTASRGAAKEWATTTGATVDGTEYSAKHYASAAATSASNASTSETNASNAQSAAETAQGAAETAQAAAEVAQAAAELAADNFDDTYLGAKASDPTVDNDGDALTTGDLYFNTTSNELKIYNGSAWQVAAISAAGLLAAANNLSDLDNTGTARTNLGVAIGSDVQAYDADNAVTDAAQTFTVSQRGTITTDNDLSFDQNATNNFKCTPTGTGTLTFTNHTAGQSGNILLDNSGGHAISLAATTKGDANLATTISTAGTYWLSYYDDGTNAYVVTSAVFA